MQSCSWAIRCLVCQRLVFLEDSGALSLPCNKALEVIVDKYFHRKKVVSKCDMCLVENPDEGLGLCTAAEKGGKGVGGDNNDVNKDGAAVATVMCVQCEVFYCDGCRDVYHPATGVKSRHPSQ